MKKILISILGILLGFVGFSSAQSCVVSNIITPSNSYMSIKNIFFHFGLSNKSGIYSISGISYFDSYGRYSFPGNYSGFLCYISRGTSLFVLNPDGFNYNINCSLVENITSDISSTFHNLGGVSNGVSYFFSNPIIIDSSLYSDVFLFISGKSNPIYYKTSSDSLDFGGYIYSTGSDYIPYRFYYTGVSYINGFYTPVVYDICFSYEGNSTFTVNYGNQSKEYTISEDIDIFINSPVIKNGSTYIYNGSTGINLFYNNSSVFYDKNKLYLGGSFGYNNNVFTPVCL